MGLFDRFKKKAEEIYNNISSSLESLIKRDENIEKVSTIPTTPIDTGTNTTTTAVKEKPQETKPATVAPIVPETPKAPVVDKNAHLTFFKNNDYLVTLDSVKELMKSRDFEFLESEESKRKVRLLNNMSSSLEHKSAFINDVEYNVKYDELKGIIKQFSNKIQTMRSEHETLERLDSVGFNLGDKNNLPPDEGTLMHRIQAWEKIKNRVDLFGPEYDFYSSTAESKITFYKDNVKDNNYIVCARVMAGESELNKMNLDSLYTMKKLKYEFEQHNIEGPTFKKMLDSINAYKEFEKLDDSFKTPRMQESAKNFRAQAEAFCKIADSLQKTGTIPELDKGLDLVSAFEQEVEKFDRKYPRVNNEKPSTPKVTI